MKSAKSARKEKKTGAISWLSSESGPSYSTSTSISASVHTQMESVESKHDRYEGQRRQVCSMDSFEGEGPWNLDIGWPHRRCYRLQRRWSIRQIGILSSFGVLVMRRVRSCLSGALRGIALFVGIILFGAIIRWTRKGTIEELLIGLLEVCIILLRTFVCSIVVFFVPFPLPWNPKVRNTSMGVSGQRILPGDRSFPSSPVRIQKFFGRGSLAFSRRLLAVMVLIPNNIFQLRAPSTTRNFMYFGLASAVASSASQTHSVTEICLPLASSALMCSVFRPSSNRFAKAPETASKLQQVSRWTMAGWRLNLAFFPEGVRPGCMITACMSSGGVPWSLFSPTCNCWSDRSGSSGLEVVLLVEIEGGGGGKSFSLIINWVRNEPVLWCLRPVATSFSERFFVGGIRFVDDTVASSFGLKVGSSCAECEVLLLEVSAGLSTRSKTRLASVSGVGGFEGKSRVSLLVGFPAPSTLVEVANSLLNSLFGFDRAFLKCALMMCVNGRAVRSLLWEDAGSSLGCWMLLRIAPAVGRRFLLPILPARSCWVRDVRAWGLGGRVEGWVAVLWWGPKSPTFRMVGPSSSASLMFVSWRLEESAMLKSRTASVGR